MVLFSLFLSLFVANLLNIVLYISFCLLFATLYEILLLFFLCLFNHIFFSNEYKILFMNVLKILKSKNSLGKLIKNIYNLLNTSAIYNYHLITGGRCQHQGSNLCRSRHPTRNYFCSRQIRRHPWSCLLQDQC